MYSIEAGKSLPGIRKALRVVTQGFSKKNISYGEAKPQSINIFLHGCSHRVAVHDDLGRIDSAEFFECVLQVRLLRVVVELSNKNIHKTKLVL